jgi:hypothetical protein
MEMPKTVPVYHSEFEEYARKTWGPLIAQQNQTLHDLRRKMEKMDAEWATLSVQASHGRALSKLIKRINDDPMLSPHWNRIMMMLKLTNATDYDDG